LSKARYGLEWEKVLFIACPCVSSLCNSWLVVLFDSHALSSRANHWLHYWQCDEALPIALYCSILISRQCWILRWMGQKQQGGDNMSTADLFGAMDPLFCLV
jgi:hypothetical protein